MSYEIILGTFKDDTEKVNDLLTRYEAAQDQLGITEALAIIRPEEGDDQIKIMGEHKKKARRIGAISGAVLGVLGGPAAMVVLGAAGAAVGNLISNLTHAGISKKMIETVEQGLDPGSSAVLIIVEVEHRNLIINDLKDVGAATINESIESHEIEGKYMISPSSGMSETQ
jgi:uncharacterized membrane protein